MASPQNFWVGDNEWKMERNTRPSMIFVSSHLPPTSNEGHQPFADYVLVTSARIFSFQKLILSKASRHRFIDLIFWCVHLYSLLCFDNRLRMSQGQFQTFMKCQFLSKAHKNVVIRSQVCRNMLIWSALESLDLCASNGGPNVQIRHCGADMAAFEVAGPESRIWAKRFEG